jgi:hypothetical protein
VTVIQQDRKRRTRWDEINRVACDLLVQPDYIRNMKTIEAEKFLLEEPRAKEHKRRVKDIGIYQHYARGFILGIRLHLCFYLLNDLLNGTEMREALADRVPTKVVCSFVPPDEVAYGHQCKGNAQKQRPKPNDRSKQRSKPDGRSYEDDICYEKVPVASPYLLPNEVVPHFKAPFFLNGFSAYRESTIAIALILSRSECVKRSCFSKGNVPLSLPATERDDQAHLQPCRAELDLLGSERTEAEQNPHR